jgi:WD40 repeat protein
VKAWPDGDKTIRFWEIKTGKEKLVLKSHTGPVVSLAVSKDGKKLLSGSHDSTVRVWEIETGKELRKFTDHGKTAGIAATAFAPDGTLPGPVAGPKRGTVMLPSPSPSFPPIRFSVTRPSGNGRGRQVSSTRPRRAEKG